MSGHHRSTAGPVPRSAFVVLLALNVLFRLYLASLPGYVEDVQRYKNWAIGIALDGLPRAYEGLGVDYPPFILYPMYAVGELYLALEPEVAPGVVPDTPLLDVLIKIPHLSFDLLLGGLLWWLVARQALWRAARATPGWGRLACLVYLWNPAVLWHSGYWGQPDGIHSALAVAALALLGLERLASSGALLCAASLMKPLAAPLVPVLVWTAALRRGAQGLLLAAFGGLAAAIVLFLPFILSGRFLGALGQVLLDVQAMPLTSANAHNLWWILGPFRNADATILRFLTAKIIGLALFGAAYLGLVARSWRWIRSASPGESYRAALFLTSAAVVCSFFFLSTHLHENHLFMALPLLLTVAGRSRGLAWLAIGCSVTIFLNGFLHDVDLPYRLPSVLGAASPAIDPHLWRPYTWTQLLGSHLNVVLAGTVAVGTYVAAWKIRP